MRPLLVRSALRSARASSLRLCLAQRFSIKAEAASAAKPVGLDPSRLTITKTSSPKGLSKPEDLVFGREFTGKKSSLAESVLC
ncbi:branched-chain amino acid aminotransferase cytosolic [Fusarium albosuccineum]|uniref:Branched-chain amino acid aminotransferase cytosolic n=1 Tax=Fusarium albosuccineum TaxID=1237068 RepID=A0A8H4L0M2_9HYPO|nr:branched-chain amino acid aminotransferase cytosolic [Fusarium albosuccineum]